MVDERDLKRLAVENQKLRRQMWGGYLLAILALIAAAFKGC